MVKKSLLFFSVLILVTNTILAQATKDYVDTSLVQFSGMVLTGDTDELFPIPFATIAVIGEGRGTYANFRGFFSLVVRKGDKIRFSAIGFRTTTYTVPDTLQGSRFSMVQLLSADTINLPETVIFPWPNRDNLKAEFLAMDVTQELEEKAKENLAASRLEALRNGSIMDANENSDYYLRQQAKSYYAIGQAPPMNIYNPLAWAEFFKAWKEGKFKQKKKK